MKQRIDQLLAGYAEGDAISQEARFMRGVFHDLGYDSEIFAPADRIAPHVQDDCRPLADFDVSNQKITILHYSTKSEASELFINSNGRQIIRYHNITPAHYYAGFDDGVAEELRSAQAELRRVVKVADGCWSASAYNAEELVALGVKDSRVLPLMFSMDEFEDEPDEEVMAEFGDDLTNWLFVGRIAPNKCIEELISSFAWYQIINPESRLIIVGSVHSCPSYYAMLRLWVSQLELTNVCFTGFVTNAARFSMYECADVFVTASRHEGYCLPLIEAMARNLPVIARHSGGMPEAMNAAGVAFDNLEPKEMALLIQRILCDQALRDDVMQSQQTRMREIDKRGLEQEILNLL